MSRWFVNIPSEMAAKRRDKRPAKRIDNSGHQGLFAATQWVVAEDRPEPKGKVIFLNPSPRGIWLGCKRLEDHLRECGEAEALIVREFVGGLNWESFENRYQGGGRPAYHPALMVSLILFGLMQGRSSLRGLEKIAQMDVRCWWLTGGLQPDYTAICRFLKLHGEELTASFFEALTREVIHRVGSNGTLAGDGTVVQAAASRYRRLQQEVALEQAREAREQAQAKPEDQQLQEQAAAAEQVARVVEQRKAAREKSRRKGEIQVSPREPEAVIQPMKNKVFAPAYRPSVLANGDRVVVAQGIHPTSETVLVEGLLAQSKRVNGAPEVLMLDAGYFEGAVLGLGVEDPDLKHLLCPEGKVNGEGPWERPSKSAVPKSVFEYEEGQDRYRCPAGEYLTPREKGTTERGKGYVVYRSKACRKCALRKECTSGQRGREIKRYEDEELKEAMRAVMRQPGAQRLYRRRQAIVEPVFAELQQLQGLRRFRRYGLRAVALEFSLHIMAHNLRRLIVLTAKRAGGPLGVPFPGIFGSVCRTIRDLLNFPRLLGSFRRLRAHGMPHQGPVSFCA